MQKGMVTLPDKLLHKVDAAAKNPKEIQNKLVRQALTE